MIVSRKAKALIQGKDDRIRELQGEVNRLRLERRKHRKDLIELAELIVNSYRDGVVADELHDIGKALLEGGIYNEVS